MKKTHRRLSSRGRTAPAGKTHGPRPAPSSAAADDTADAKLKMLAGYGIHNRR